MDKAAVVTGASSGIGLAIARALAEDGYGVALGARHANLLEEIAAELGADIVATVRWLLSLRPIVQVSDVVLERTLA